mmetsp:Transcript_15266/g.63408  ORF Transcript_15266/g.63408 Transcript_15266/m.63408 type:complete len:205 (-) Transcript_15266:393-1007(-)
MGRASMSTGGGREGLGSVASPTRVASRTSALAASTTRASSSPSCGGAGVIAAACSRAACMSSACSASSTSVATSPGSFSSTSSATCSTSCGSCLALSARPAGIQSDSGWRTRLHSKLSRACRRRRPSPGLDHDAMRGSSSRTAFWMPTPHARRRARSPRKPRLMAFMPTCRKGVSASTITSRPALVTHWFPHSVFTPFGPLSKG